MDVNNDIRFCELLSKMIKNSGMSQVEFYQKLKIKKPYFYDILGGRSNPPPPIKQFAIIEILVPDEQTRNLFFELAAKERQEVPADIAKYLEQEDRRTAIRLEFEYADLIINKGGKSNG